MTKKEEKLLKFIGEEMTINSVPPAQLAYRVRYGAIEIMMPDTMLPTVYFKKNSARLAMMGWTVPQVEEFLSKHGARRLGPVKKRAPKIYPIYD